MDDLIIRNLITAALLLGVLVGVVGFIILVRSILIKVTSRDDPKTQFVIGIIMTAVGIISGVSFLLMTAGMAGEVSHHRYDKIDRYIMTDEQKAESSAAETRSNEKIITE